MTREQVAHMIKDMADALGCEYAYYAFDNGTELAPPFLVYYYPSSDNEHADGITYQRVDNLSVELYTKRKDFEAEEKVEDVFATYGIATDKTETYLDGEYMYLILYECEVIINGEN